MTTDKRIISFRPFRRVGDKLVVTTYQGWYKLYTANYNGADVKLLPFPEIKKGEVVYSMGDPAGINKYWHPTKFEALFWPIDADNIRATDCHGCPIFSHITATYVSENYPEKIDLFETLTADIVYEYFELMRDQLEKINWLPQSPIKLDV
jgi:hypothetical protein